MSFFDEDDEPPRTARTRVRPSPPPRRGRVTSGGSSDAQTVLVRRMIAGIVGAADPAAAVLRRARVQQLAPQERAARLQPQVTEIGTESQQTGEAVLQADGRRRADLADRALPVDPRLQGLGRPARSSRPQALSVPGDMTDAQQSLLIALELRRDGLQTIADEIKNALGDEGDDADQAINAHRRPDARVRRLRRPVQRARRARSSRRRCRTRGIGGRTSRRRSSCARSPGSRRRTSPPSSAQQLSTGGDARQRRQRRDKNQPTGPGLHGTGLNATSYGNVTLQPAASNRLDLRQGPAVHRRVHQPGRQRRVQRQGHAARSQLASGRLADHAQQDRPAGRQGREGDRRAPAQPRTAARRGGEHQRRPWPRSRARRRPTTTSRPTRRSSCRASRLPAVSDFSEAPGIVALAAAAAALIALIWLLVLSFRFRRVRSAQKVVLGEHGQTDLVAHASDLQHAFEALHGRVEDVADAPGRAHGGRRGPARRRDRLPLARPLRRLRRDVRPPVDDDRAARRRSQWRRAVLDRAPRHRAPVLQADPRRPRRAPALARGGRGRAGSRSPAARSAP